MVELVIVRDAYLGGLADLSEGRLGAGVSGKGVINREDAVFFCAQAIGGFGPLEVFILEPIRQLPGHPIG